MGPTTRRGGLCCGELELGPGRRLDGRGAITHARCKDNQCRLSCQQKEFSKNYGEPFDYSNEKRAVSRTSGDSPFL